MSETANVPQPVNPELSLKKEKGLIGAIFDFKMKELVTLKFTRIIYTIVVIFASITAGIGFIVSIPTIFGPIVVLFLYFIYLIFFRMFLEFITSLVNVNYNTRRLVELSEHVMKNSR